ncbi:MAG: hypothetical protein Q9196_003270 [Gyalolechia fulgens]
MHFSSSLALIISYLLCIASAILAIPLTITPEAASPSQALRARQPEVRPRYFPLDRNHGTVVADSATHRTRFTMLTAFYPATSVIVRTMYSMYFEILFNLSPQGDWYHMPAKSKILLKQKDLYLLFFSEDPLVPVPWILVKEWVEAMELTLDRGGFVGTYIASIARHGADGFADFWVQLGIGDPPLLTAAAARKGK